MVAELMEETFSLLRSALKVGRWPGVEEGTSWGTPALVYKKKMLVRVREPGVFVVGCELEEKEFLMQSLPDVFFETPHYSGYPALLVRADLLPLDELVDRVERAWRSLATKKDLHAFSAGGGN